MKQIYLVPSLYEKNVYMYCNYARMNSHEERCLVCKRNVNTKKTNERLTNWLVSFSFPVFLCAGIESHI